MSVVIQRDLVLHGIPLSAGVAVGRICMFNEHRHSNLAIYHVSGEGVDREINRIERSIEIAAERLVSVIERVREEIGHAEAEIFVAQKMIVEDQSLLSRTADLIRSKKLNAESAVTMVLDEYETRLQQMDDIYIRERASDFGEVKRRILDVLGNMNPDLQCNEPHCQHGRNRVIVAEELTPTITVEVDARNTLGFVTERGGQSSHAAILARSLGVPAVSGISKIREKAACGLEILVNGYDGEVILNPSEATVLELRRKYSDSVRKPTLVEPVDGLVVRANINMADEITDATELAAEGIGLYRTEIEVIAAHRMLAEDELLTNYLRVAESMAGQPVYFRLFDIGSDKPLPALDMPSEANPALGLRGARLLLSRPDILRPQARALTRLSQKFPVYVLYPMIIDLNQFRALRNAFESAALDFEKGRMLHGVMFEVPAACLGARRLYNEIDFGSIGTNDLIQYLYAGDRNNELVTADINAEHTELWELLEWVAAAAVEYGKPLSVCGEMAGNPLHLKRLIKLGLREFSVNTRFVPVIRLAGADLLEKEKQETERL